MSGCLTIFSRLCGGCTVVLKMSSSLLPWGGDPVSGWRSCGRAKGPGTGAGAFAMAFSLSGGGPRGPRWGAKGSCGTPRVSSPGHNMPAGADARSLDCGHGSHPAVLQPHVLPYQRLYRGGSVRKGELETKSNSVSLINRISSSPFLTKHLCNRSSVQRGAMKWQPHRIS